MSDASPNRFKLPMIFVPHGEAPLPDWLAAYPGAVRVPAVLIPRGTPTAPAALAGTAIAADGGTGLALSSAEALSALVATPAWALAALAAGLLYPNRTNHEAEDLRGRRQEGALNVEALAPPPAPPADDPGHVPPALPDPHESLTPPDVPVAKEGFTTTPSPPVLIVTPIPDPSGPTVHESRTDGLPKELKSRSSRARRAAEQADPLVPAALDPKDWEAHHLISIAGIRAVPELLAAAARAGWRTDDAQNVAPLPSSQEARGTLLAAGIDRPVHRGSHTNLNETVLERLLQIKRELDASAEGQIPEEYERRARSSLESLQHELRDALNGEFRVNMRNIRQGTGIG